MLLSIWAWVILSGEDGDGECTKNAAGLLELLVDMIILLYMRALRLLSILLFIIICGPLLLVCWWKNRPAPTENPAALRQNFSKVTISQFHALREMDYNHLGKSNKSSRNNSVVSSGSESTNVLNESMT